MTMNVPSRRAHRRTDVDVITRAVSYDRRRDAKRLLQAKRGLAALLIAGAVWVAFTALAVAGEPATTPVQAALAPAGAPTQPAAVMAPMTQETLLERQSPHAGQLFILDVRTPQEFAEGHVPGAVNVPYDQMASRMSEVPMNKDVVIYCKSGRRAGIAADLLAANGYTRLSHLEGDMPAWVEKGRPVAMP